MSRFLAAIHFKQYEKIQNQERMLSTILDLNHREEWIDDLREKVNRDVGIIEDKSLETIVDENNIHAWLDNQIDIVENRLSYVVDILIEDKNRLDIIIREIKELGRVKGNKVKDDLKDIYKIIDESFLNGMPCDGIIEVEKIDENSLSWTMDRDIHSNYWNNPEDKIYYKIKTSFIEGLVENKNIKYLEYKNIYKLELR